MKPIKVGVVGLGMVAQIMHLHYLRDIDDFELSAICDISKKTLDYVGDCYGIGARYTDAEEMIRKEKLDAVFILTFLHSGITKAAARAGIHIFCEKPVAFSPKECAEMIRDVDKAGVVFMIGYMKRYDDGYLMGLKHFDEMKKKGDVRMVHVHDACFRNDLALKTMYQLRSFNDIPRKVIAETEAKILQRLREALGAAPQCAVNAYRMLLETGSHDITVLRGAFGDPVKVLNTEIWPQGNWFASTLDYGGDVRCVFDVARTARNWGDEHITAFGMTKTVSVLFPIPFHRNEPTLVKITSMEGDSTAEQVIVPSYSESFRNELLHFADCIKRRKTPLTSLAEGMRDTELMVKIIKKFKA